jgi:outer membrane protein, adhesin transport system
MSGLKRNVCLLLLLITSAAGAQQSITLKQLLNSTDQRAPQLLTDSSAIRIRQAQAREIRNNWLPNLNLSYQADAGTSNNVIGAYFGFGIVPSSSSGVHSTNVTTGASYNLGIAALDWEIYNFGAYAAADRVANANITVEQNNFAESKFALQGYTIDIYLKLVRLQNLLAIQAMDVQRNQQVRNSIESLAKSGVRPGVDTSIAEAELSKSRLNYIEVANQLKQVQLQLSAVSGLPYQAIVPDTTTSDQLIAQPVTFAGMDTVNHPLINYYRSIYQTSMLQEDYVRKQYNPKIKLEAAAWDRGSSINSADQYGSFGSGFGFDRDNYLVGLGISFNVFDLRRKQLKLRTQRAATDYSLNKMREQEQLLAVSAAQADIELQTAQQRLKEIPDELRAAERGYRQKLSLYRSGLTDILELAQALQILYRAETDEAQAKYDYANAVFQKAITGNQLNQVLNTLK